MEQQREPADWARESILADPLGQIVRTVTRALPDRTGAGVTPVKVAGDNPNRLALFVQATTLEDVFLSPFQSAPPLLAVAQPSAKVPQLIHVSAYPGLCQGEWWCICTLGVTIKVYETEVQR